MNDVLTVSAGITVDPKRTALLIIDMQNDFVISAKRRFDAFLGTELDLLLRGLKVQNLIFAGVCTDICVVSTAMTARNHDYRCYVLRDAVDATSAARQEATLLCMSHVFARVGDTAEAAELFGLGPKSAAASSALLRRG